MTHPRPISAIVQPLVARAQAVREASKPKPPYLRWRHPPGCPDADWCSGNRLCYWDCQGTRAEAAERAAGEGM